jgi:hypothetical protein
MRIFTRRISGALPAQRSPVRRREALRRALTPAVSAIFGMVMAPAGAQADEACGRSDRPWVAVDASVGPLRSVVPLMRAGLAARQVDVCAEGSPHAGTPIATVDVSAQGEGATIAVEVRDRLTAKRVVRDVDLAAVPPDGRALTLAAAAEELLRATWAELGLTKAPAPAAPVPPAVRVLVEEDRPPTPRARPPQPTMAFATMAALDVIGGPVLLGADVRFTAPAAQRLAATARLGLREGFPADAPDGKIRTRVYLAGLGASARVTAADLPYAVDALVRFDAAIVSFDALPSPRATGQSQSGLAAMGAAGVDGWVAIAPSVRLTAEVLADLALRPVHARDQGQEVTSIAGAGVAAGVGLGVAF